MYCHGTSSIAHLFYILYEESKNEKYLQLARGGAQWLQNIAGLENSHTYSWKHASTWNDTGLLTGTASIGNSFLYYYQWDKFPQYLEYAKYAAYWLISNAHFPDNNDRDQVNWLNYVGTPDTDYGSQTYYTSWYNGASGIGLFFLRLSQSLTPAPEPHIAPVLDSIGSLNTMVRKPIDIQLSAQNVHGLPVKFLLSNAPEGARITDDRFIWKPKDNQYGNFKIQFIVTDGWFMDFEWVDIYVKKNKKSGGRR
jgi:hypothetical protein